MADLQLRIEELEVALRELLRVYDVELRRDQPSWVADSPRGAGAAWARAARVMPQQAEPREQLYYIQDKRTVVGNCVSWWCPKGAGYTCELDKAGRYPLGEHRDTDVLWPVEVIERLALRHVRFEPLGPRLDVVGLDGERGYSKEFLAAHPEIKP